VSIRIEAPGRGLNSSPHGDSVRDECSAVDVLPAPSAVPRDDCVRSHLSAPSLFTRPGWVGRGAMKVRSALDRALAKSWTDGVLRHQKRESRPGMGGIGPIEIR
jgi:hypothetical protein